MLVPSLDQSSCDLLLLTAIGRGVRTGDDVALGTFTPLETGRPKCSFLICKRGIYSQLRGV